MKPRLERWILFHDALVGYLFDSKEHSPGTRVLTRPLRFIDHSNFEAETTDASFKLGEPGTHEEHNQTLLGGI